MTKSIRLKNFEYSSNGYYFVTICSYEKKCIFGKINENDILIKSVTGKIIVEEINNLEIRYSNIKIDNYIVMPNHVHLIIFINQTWQEQSPCPTLFDVICTLKSITTKRINKYYYDKGKKIWQSRFHDHIIRNQDEYEKIWEYVEYNILKWKMDKYYIDKN